MTDVLKSLQKKFSDRITTSIQQKKTVNLFCKSLSAYLILKILFSWPTWTILIQYSPPQTSNSLFSSVIFFPSHWAIKYLDLFCWISLLLIFTNLFIRRNYLTSILVFWITINLIKINFPVANGSDLVLLMLLALAIPMSGDPFSKNRVIQLVQVSIFNVAVLLCQIQIAIIYFVSGWDKLITESWRSGAAIQHVTRLDYMVNPNLSNFIPESGIMSFFIAWIAIAFELLFPVLICMKKTRMFILVTGIVFHLMLWIFLSLPDFGLIMMLSYIIFLRDEDGLIDKVHRLPWLRNKT